MKETPRKIKEKRLEQEEREREREVYILVQKHRP